VCHHLWSWGPTSDFVGGDHRAIADVLGLRIWMVKLKFVLNTGEEQIVETYAGLTLMEAASAVGIEGIEAICGGSCICGTCHVYVEGGYTVVGEPSDDEEAVLAETGVQKPNSRLGCQIRLSESCDGMTFAVAPPRRD
jgi:2Fe-2S ferredoxin